MLLEALTGKGLSRRECEVAEFVSRGLSNKEVARQLFVTEKTVKFHLTNIYKKMSVKSRAQLIVWCTPHATFEEKTKNSRAIEMPPIVIEAADDDTEWLIPAGHSRVGGNA